MDINLKVVGVGDNTVDIYVDNRECFPGGNCVNFSVFASRLGAQASYIGVLGSDENGDFLAKAMHNEKVNLKRVRFSKKRNSYTFIRHENKDRIFINSNPSTSQSLEINKEDLDFLSSHQLIHTSIYSKLERYLPDLRALDFKISYDFSNRFSSIFMKNILPWIDYGFFSWSGRNDENILTFLKKWTDLYKTELIVTNGIKGSYALNNNKLIHIPAKEIDLVDTMGVGDAFITSYLISRLKGKIIKECIEEGTSFAAENCLHEGSFGYKRTYQEPF